MPQHTLALPLVRTRRVRVPRWENWEVGKKNGSQLFGLQWEMAKNFRGQTYGGVLLKSGRRNSTEQYFYTNGWFEEKVSGFEKWSLVK